MCLREKNKIKRIFRVLYRTHNDDTSPLGGHIVSRHDFEKHN